MLTRREHELVLIQTRREAGHWVAAHREALTTARSPRRPHRLALQEERRRLGSGRKEHKVALRQNRWLLTLADLLTAGKERAA